MFRCLSASGVYGKWPVCLSVCAHHQLAHADGAEVTEEARERETERVRGRRERSGQTVGGGRGVLGVQTGNTVIATESVINNMTR